MAVPEGRVFRGRTAAQRTAERRARLLDAALDLIGSDGWPAATMTAICRRAGLTERYFYESFRDRDELYVALLDALAAEVEAAVLGALGAPLSRAERLRAAARALLDVFLGDPRKGRAALLEGLGSERLQRRRREVLASFERLVREEDPGFSQVASVALVGAVDELVTRRLDGSLRVSDEALADHIAALAAALLEADAAANP